MQQMVNHKVNNLSVSELMSLSKKYNMNITQQHATQILTILREQHVNIFNPQERIQLLKRIEKVVGRQTAQQINKLFMSFIN
jgi:hypothetical protein